MMAPLGAGHHHARGVTPPRHRSLHWKKMARNWDGVNVVAELPRFRDVGANWLANGMDKTRDDRTTIMLAHEVEEIVGPTRLSRLHETVVGGPVTIQYVTSTNETLRLNYNDLQLVVAAHRVIGCWEAAHASPPTTILEIGGGYGGLAVKLRRQWPLARYVIVDLEEAQVLQSYYLDACERTQAGQLPDGTPSLHSLGCIDLVGVDQLQSIEQQSWDLVINMRSMQEMDPPEIARYFRFLQSTVRIGGIFYNVNRFLTGSTGIPIHASRYPYDDRWRVVGVAPFPTQSVQLEVVTQRRALPDPVGRRFIRALPANYVWQTGLWGALMRPLQFLDQLFATHASILWTPVKRLMRSLRLIHLEKGPTHT